MSSLYQDIQDIRSLRMALREPILSASLRESVEMIHRIARIGGNGNGHGNWNASASASASVAGGWKKVEWRSPPPAPSSGYKNGGHRYGNGSSHYGGGGNRGRKEHVPAGIPLVNGNHAAESSADGFETVSSRSRAYAPRSRHHSEFNSSIPLKYVSRFRKASGNVEDAIMTKIMGKLNKFSASNYDEIKEFITHIIDSGETEMIKCFMKLVFQKAASEEMFCPLYARLLSELSARYPVLLEDMSKLYSEYMEIFDDVSDATDDETYQELCQRNVEKKYRRGYSQFLAELIKHQVIDVDVFLMTVTKIVQQVENQMMNKNAVKVVEELADCMMKIMKAIQAQPPQPQPQSQHADTEEKEQDQKLPLIRRLMKDQMESRIYPLTQRNALKEGLSNKARFTFMDCYEGIQQF